MYLYHPSDTKFDTIKVKYFGRHKYTLNEVKASPIKRAFYYLSPISVEKLLKNCKYIYKIKVQASQLYNLRRDKCNLKTKFKNIHKLLSYLKKHYLGVIYKPNGYCIVCIFQDMKPIEIIER